MKAVSSIARRFVDIRKNEREPAFLFFCFWFLVILVFQVLRPLKKGLFLEHLGAYLELYAKLSNILVALLAVVVFTRISILTLVRRQYTPTLPEYHVFPR